MTATGYSGTVVFSSSDRFPAALPASYTFTAGDAGVHIFVNGVTMKTAGSRTLTVADTVNTALVASQPLTVQHAPASKLELTGLPNPSIVGTFYGVTVTAKDPYGNRDTEFGDEVRFTSTDTGAALPGNYIFQTADAGIHFFPAAVSFYSSGLQTVTVSDVTNPSVTNGTQTVTVNPPAGPPRATVPESRWPESDRPRAVAYSAEIAPRTGGGSGTRQRAL